MRTTSLPSTTAPASTLGDVAAALTYFLTRPEQASLIAIAGRILLLRLPAWIASMQVFADQLENAKKYCRILLEYEGPAVGVSNATGHRRSLRFWRLAARACRCSVGPRICRRPCRCRSSVASKWSTATARRVRAPLALPSQVMPDDQTLSGRMSGVIEAYQTDVAGTLASAGRPTCIC